MSAGKKERGITLAIGLAMLVVLTLLVISAIRSSNTELRIVGNMQAKEEAEAAAQQAIERVISNNDFTIQPPAPQTIGIYNVTFAPAPSCTSVKSALKSDPGVPYECLGSAGSTYCYWTTWDVTAQVRDTTTGSSVTIHQGIKMIAGLDAAVAYCGI